MADETKAPINWQSLAQFLAVMIALISCAVAIEHRLTKLEIGQDAPLTDKQKQAIREYVTAFMEKKNQSSAEEDDGEDSEPQKAKPKKAKQGKKSKITGQAEPIRADEPIPRLYSNTELPSIDNSRYFDWRQTN